MEEMGLPVAPVEPIVLERDGQQRRLQRIHLGQVRLRHAQVTLELRALGGGAAVTSARSLAISAGTVRTWSWMRFSPLCTIASRVIWWPRSSRAGAAGYTSLPCQWSQ